MSTPTRTLEDTIAWEVARLGISRHDPQCDWSGGYDVNDCALFQSAALGWPREVWNVSVFTTIDGGTYHAGSAGIQRGDVLLFGWTPGHFDHTEMALGPAAGSTLSTIGANGGTSVAVAYHSRNLSNVTGFYRPDYPSSPTTSTEDDMTDDDKKWIADQITQHQDPEVFQRTSDGAIALAHVPSGYWKQFDSMQSYQTFLGLGIFSADQPIRAVDDNTFAGIKGECDYALTRTAK